MYKCVPTRPLGDLAITRRSGGDGGGEGEGRGMGLKVDPTLELYLTKK